jgi:hypothetical protein
MGLMPDDYYNMLPVDFDIMMNGHMQRIDRESSNHRKAAFLICASNGYKGTMQKFIDDFWQLNIDKVKEIEKIETPEPDYWQKVSELNSKLKRRKKKK